MGETVGSQRLLQAAVQQAPRALDSRVRERLRLEADATIDWRSPIAENGYKEYRDGEALAALGVVLEDYPLSNFWPARGPVWDGLARVSTGQVLLVEAKAHIAELASSGSRAGEASMRKIEAAFAAVRAEIAPRSSAAWTSTFYQYANRLAFLYLLRKNRVEAHLLQVMFLNAKDVDGPSTPAEWNGAIRLLHAALGITGHKLKPFVHDIFIDAKELDLQPLPSAVV